MFSEPDIISRCQNQDRKAQEWMFREYSSYMMGICLRYSRNREDAQDLLHEGFIKAFSGIRDFKGQSSLKTWLASIFVNTSLSHLKKKNKQYLLDIDAINAEDIAMTEIDDDIFDHSIQNLSLAEVLEYVQQLPDKYRIIINMYVIDDYSHAEIARALNISDGTSKSQLSRARKMLGAMITQKKTQYEKAS